MLVLAFKFLAALSGMCLAGEALLCSPASFNAAMFAAALSDGMVYEERILREEEWRGGEVEGG